jgi:predicted short-subunit dehydrogenase-like oxidoreductase (DUF2520 family)
LQPNCFDLNKNSQIVLIGSGNVASHLGKVLVAKGYTITQVWSRTAVNAISLAGQINSTAIADLSLVNKSADFYIISVADDAIPVIVGSLPQISGIVVHTSGSQSIEVLNRFQQHGVLYPLQTFSKSREVDFNEIPLCLEASDSEILDNIQKLALTISPNIHYLNSVQRRYAHLAAVFANNFSNYMQVISSDILQSNQIDKNLLKPLIEESFNKLCSMDAWEAQTGPAKRLDTELISKHLDLLKPFPQFYKIYQTISESIVDRANINQQTN